MMGLLKGKRESGQSKNLETRNAFVPILPKAAHFSMARRERRTRNQWY